jgi:hypothetical protein
MSSAAKVRIVVRPGNSSGWNAAWKWILAPQQKKDRLSGDNTGPVTSAPTETPSQETPNGTT